MIIGEKSSPPKFSAVLSMVQDQPWEEIAHLGDYISWSSLHADVAVFHFGKGAEVLFPGPEF